jgi:hypothetical protein
LADETASNGADELVYTAYYKVANGEDISAAEAPGTFDLKVGLPVATRLCPVLEASLKCGKYADELHMRIGQGEEEGLAEVCR